MDLSNSYVLVIDSASEDLVLLDSLTDRLPCSVVVAYSPEQALAVTSQGMPYLVILVGDRPDGASRLIHHLRGQARQRHHNMMIVALTNTHTPHWLHQEQNPGFDGFLVKPISGDVLTSLVQSAWVRQSCYQAS